MRAFRLAILVGALLPGCRFDETLPPSAMVACRGNLDCPRSTGCRQPLGRCVPAFANDTQPPGVVAQRVAYRAESFMGLRALGVSGVALIELELSEPISNTPELQVPGLSCGRASWTTNGVTFECTASASAAQGLVNGTVELVDLVSNRATVELQPLVEVDTVAPAALAPVELINDPWAAMPFSGVRLPAGSVPAAHRVLVLDDRGTLLQTLEPADDGAVTATVDGRLAAAVSLLDGAGNRSAVTPISTLAESLTGPFSPHVIWRVGSLGPARTTGRDWAETLDSAGALPTGVSFIQHRHDVPSDPDLRFVTDVSTGELLAFSQTGPHAVHRYGPGGFKLLAPPLALLGEPPPVRGAAFGYDRSANRVVRFGGRDAQGALTGRGWQLDERGWSTIPTLPPQVRDSAMLEWSTRGLLLMGGVRMSGLTDEVELINGLRIDSTTLRLPVGLIRFGGHLSKQVGVSHGDGREAEEAEAELH